MLKKTLISAAILFLTAIGPSFAAESFVTIVNPVRGDDFWDTTGQEPLSVVKDQLKVIEENNIAATWLLRPDVLFDENLAGYFKNFPKNQEMGIFLEVTPAWAKAAKVEYRQSPHWHFSRSVFLSGYEIPEREKLINAAAEKFKSLFGGFSSVGAWHVDAYSGQYLRKNYGVTGVLICADQFSTDDYSVWGGWWGAPYYPAKTNILRPAKSSGEKLDVVVFWWAARDPLYGYGPGVGNSTFSVQPNDYQGHGLGIDYFKKLAKIYLSSGKNRFGQLTIGLENTDNWANDKEEYFRQIDFVAKTYKVSTMKEFSLWYQKAFTSLSPAHKIEGEVESEGKAVWLMSPAGRVGYLEKDGQNILRDLRVYREGWSEPYLLTANSELNFSLSLPAELDTVRFPGKEEKLSVAPEKLLEKRENLPRPLRLSEASLAAVKASLPFSPPVAVYLFSAALFIGFIIVAFRTSKWLGLVTALGMAAQSATMVRSGLLSPLGMEFFGPNGHDGIWHLALINELGRRILPQIPVFSGENLTNYHYIFDLLIVLVNKITQIPAINLYFQIFPVIISGLLGLFGYRFMEKWTKSKTAAVWTVFFLYFGAGFGWVVTLFRGQGLGGESLFWAQQAASTLINPPFALSLVVLLLGLNLLIGVSGEGKLGRLGKLGFLGGVFGLLFGIKSYAGVVAIGGLGAAAAWEYFTQKKTDFIKVFFAALFVGFFFLPRAASSLFIFSPFWFVHSLLSSADRFYWPRLASALQAYFASGNWLKLILAEGLALAIFFLGNMGTRIVFLGKMGGFRGFRGIDVFLVSVLFISGLLPLLFIQKGTPWNTIQFFYYFLFVSGLLAAKWVGEGIEGGGGGRGSRGRRGRIRRAVAMGLLVILTVPATLGTLRHYLPKRPAARVSFEELEALEFLRKQSGGVVLTFPFNNDERFRYPDPRPLFSYETTAYVAALSDKQTFLEDEMNLEILGTDWRPRRKMVEEFFKTDKTAKAKDFLRDNKISYLYLLSHQTLRVRPEEIGLEKIFDNGAARVYVGP